MSSEIVEKNLPDFISLDLSSAEGITIIDRGKRNDVMEEQKFTLTGMTDESTSVEIGQLSGALVAALDLGEEAATAVEPEPVPVPQGNRFGHIYSISDSSDFHGILKACSETAC